MIGQIRQLLQKGDLEKAAKIVDDRILSKPNAFNYQLCLIIADNQSFDPKLFDQAIARYEKVSGFSADRLENFWSKERATQLQELCNLLTRSTQGAARLYQRKGKLDQAIEVVSNSINTIEGINGFPESMSIALVSQKCHLLLEDSRGAEGHAALKEVVNEFLVRANKSQSSHDCYCLLSAATALNEYVKKSEVGTDSFELLREEISDLFSDVHQAEMSIESYTVLQIFTRSWTLDLLNRNPEEALAKMEKVSRLGTELQKSLGSAGQASFDALSRVNKEMLMRCRLALSNAAIVGKPAPDLEVLGELEIKNFKIKQNRGKPVLLVFESIALKSNKRFQQFVSSIPKSYGGKSLLIVSAVKTSGHHWSKEKKSPVEKEDATVDEQLEMLRELARRSGGKRPTVIVSQKTVSEYGILVLPNFVFIDAKGIVHLLNAKNPLQMKQMIKDLMLAK